MHLQMNRNIGGKAHDRNPNSHPAAEYTNLGHLITNTSMSLTTVAVASFSKPREAGRTRGRTVRGIGWTFLAKNFICSQVGFASGRYDKISLDLLLGAIL
eukprot:282117-Amphidinium_carterae.1